MASPESDWMISSAKKRINLLKQLYKYLKGHSPKPNSIATYLSKSQPIRWKWNFSLKHTSAPKTKKCPKLNRSSLRLKLPKVEKI